MTDETAKPKRSPSTRAELLSEIVTLRSIAEGTRQDLQQAQAERHQLRGQAQALREQIEQRLQDEHHRHMISRDLARAVAALEAHGVRMPQFETIPWPERASAVMGRDAGEAQRAIYTPAAAIGIKRA